MTIKHLAVAGLMASTAALATNDASALGVSVHGEQQCDFEFNYTVKSKPGYLAVLDQGEMLYKISDDGVLYQAGEAVEQNRLQRRTNLRFKEEVESLPSDIMTLTLEAMEIAFVSLAATLDMLGLDNDEFDRDLKRAMHIGKDRLHEQLQAHEGTWVMGPDDFSIIGDQAFGPEFEQEVEQIAEKYAGKIAIGALKAAFSAGESIEQKAEQLEAMVEARAEEIEGSALQLCERIRSIQGHDQAMRKSVSGLSEMPLIEEGQDGA